MQASGRPPACRTSELVAAVRHALRRYHETQHLLQSPLLMTPLCGLNAPLDQRVQVLRRRLRERIEDLARNTRTEQAYRALQHTFLEPAPTQLLAAERAHLAFGTYRDTDRRHRPRCG